MRILWRLLLWLALALVLLVVLALGVGPLFIDPTPAPGAPSGAAVAAPESRFIDLPLAAGEDLTLHYLTAGLEAADGHTAFVLLHGFTFNLFTWDRLFAAFSGHGPVLAYDQIPYGLSAKPVPAGDRADLSADLYSKAAALDRLFALLDHLGIERAILVGNSSGGTLALEAAHARPERVAALILLSPWVHSKRPNLPAWLVRLPQMQRLSLLLARYLGASDPLLDAAYADPERIDARRRQVSGVHRLIANWDLAWAALLHRSLTDPVEIAQSLGEITQPVLLITGAADQIVPVADSIGTAQALPNAQLVIIPDCGHLPQEECPNAVATAIDAWLQSTALH